MCTHQALVPDVVWSFWTRMHCEWPSDRSSAKFRGLCICTDRLPFPLSSAGCFVGCSSQQPIDHLVLTRETLPQLCVPLRCRFYTQASGWFICRVALAGNPFYPPEGWRVDFCCVKRFQQVIHGRAWRSAFQEATSGWVVVHEEEHSFVGKFGSELPSDEHYGKEFNLTYQMVSHEILPKLQEVWLHHQGLACGFVQQNSSQACCSLFPSSVSEWKDHSGV